MPILTVGDLIARATLTATQQAQAEGVIAASLAALESFLHRSIEEVSGAWVVEPDGPVIALPSPPIRRVAALAITDEVVVDPGDGIGWIDLVREPVAAAPWTPRRHTGVRLTRYAAGVPVESTLTFLDHPSVQSLLLAIDALSGWSCATDTPEGGLSSSLVSVATDRLTLAIHGSLPRLRVEPDAGVIHVPTCGPMLVTATHGWVSAQVPEAIREALLLDSLARIHVATSKANVAAGIKRRKMGDREIEFLGPSDRASGGMIAQTGLVSLDAANLAAPWRLAETSILGLNPLL